MRLRIVLSSLFENTFLNRIRFVCNIMLCTTVIVGYHQVGEFGKLQGCKPNVWTLHTLYGFEHDYFSSKLCMHQECCSPTSTTLTNWIANSGTCMYIHNTSLYLNWFVIMLGSALILRLRDVSSLCILHIRVCSPRLHITGVWLVPHVLCTIKLFNTIYHHHIFIFSVGQSTVVTVHSCRSMQLC